MNGSIAFAVALARDCNEEDIIIIVVIVHERKEWKMAEKFEVRGAMRTTTKAVPEREKKERKKTKKKYTVRTHLLVYFPFGQITTFSSNERKVECITVRCTNVPPAHIHTDTLAITHPHTRIQIATDKDG